jgi:hypothetical protein
LAHFGWIGWLALIGLVLIQFVWPLLAGAPIRYREHELSMAVLSPEAAPHNSVLKKID